MSPYYEDDLVTLFHGDCREVMSDMADRSVECVITDPPYDDRTHKGAKTNLGNGHGVKAVHLPPRRPSSSTWSPRQASAASGSGSG